MSLKDWIPLPRYTASDPLALLSFMARATEAELHRLADDDGRILVGAQEPWAVIARMGGASVGDRRLLRAILPDLITAGLLRVDGPHLILTRRIRVDRRRWSRLAYAEVYERDGYACRYCCATEELEIDHLVPRCQGGGDEADNLVVACRTCNGRKGGRTPAEASMVVLPIGSAPCS